MKYYLLNTAPGSWVIQKARVLSGNSLFNAMQIFRVTYGSYFTAKEMNDRCIKSAQCLMRESVYQALVRGDLTMLPACNETGFVVVDRITKLETPRFKIGKYTVL